MPRIEIPVVTIVREGVPIGAQTIADATNNHYFDGNDGNVELEIESTDGGSQTVTLETPLEVDDLAVFDFVIDVPPGTTVRAGGFRRKTFNQEPISEGSVWVNPSVSTTLKFRAFKFDSAG